MQGELVQPSGLSMPEGIHSLSVEVAPEATFENGQLSVSALVNAPLSAILSAFGFGSSHGPSTNGPPSMGFFSALATACLTQLVQARAGRSGGGLNEEGAS